MEHVDKRVSGLTMAEWDAVHRLEGMPAEDLEVALNRIFAGDHAAQGTRRM